MIGLRRDLVILAAGAMFTGVAMVGTPMAGQEVDPKATAEREKKFAAGEREAKKMLLLMDKDNNGKVSKQEFMNFMEAEFDRLDVNKDGQLDVNELTHSRVTIRSRGR